MSRKERDCLCSTVSRVISIIMVLGLTQYLGGDLVKVGEILRLATNYAI
jgi:hypothetical protein